MLTTALFAGVPSTSSASPDQAPDGKPLLGKWGIETLEFSSAVKPGNDFYRYVNEDWLKTAKLPEGFPTYDSMTQAYLRTERQLTDLIGGIASGTPTPGSPEAQIAAAYRSYTDMARRNALGEKPLEAGLAQIAALESAEDVARQMAKPFNATVIGIDVMTDSGNPQRYIIGARQSGLGLPATDYYLDDGEPFAGHRIAYRDYIEASLRRAGIDRPRERADAVLALETQIAKLQWSPAEMRDPVRMYTLMPVADLDKFAPEFPWTAYLAEKRFSDQKTIVIGTDTAVQKLARLFARTPIDTWRSYLMFHHIDDLAPLLSQEWEQAHFAFHNTRLLGIASQRPLDVRGIQFVSQVLAEPLGQAYVARYFPPESRAQMDRMVQHLKAAYRERITALTWMDDQTRAEALAKLEKVVSHVGYPEKWRDFSALTLDPADLVGNLRQIVEFEAADARATLKETRRDWQWPLAPQEVNAGYMADFNSITFPAAILQPPYFDPNADPAVNYGAIGAVIGHELGHGFDDQGSRSDGDGKLRDWWTKKSRDQFGKRTAALVKQYDAFSPIEGMNVNGSLTLGENIGDLGGVSVAHHAYRNFAKEEYGGDPPVLDGLTGDQRYFLAWAQAWRTITTQDMLRQQLLSDPHSPAEYRVNGVVRNIDAWYDAFGVKEDDALYLPPSERVSIW
ncbi:M13 family metallopeptidase [Iodidimonas sp. SYSU 1G8]|uniref:M13 family metallopeptidase n=1 Tax=Iodidimonas sp. SYSU 1G8 TaxID=3133967 RepID=UPI0031FEF793